MRERTVNFMFPLALMLALAVTVLLVVAGCSEIGDISSGSGSSAENQPDTEITADPEATAEGGSCEGGCPTPAPTPRPT